MKKSIAGIAAVWIICCSAGVTAPYTIQNDSIYKHIAVLANDSLEGRQVGEPGEWKAAQYISNVFKAAGLVPKGDNGTYFQAFEFIKRIDFGPNNRLEVNGTKLELPNEFQPMNQSASMSFKFDSLVFVNYGITVDSNEGNYDDYAGKNVSGKAVIIKRFNPDSTVNPHIDFNKYGSTTDKINNAIQHGATGIVVYTPKEQDDTLPGFGTVHVTPKDIPILILRRAGLARLGIDLDNPQINSLSGQTELFKTRDTGYNVLGYLPTGNDTTIIIGAHYDHLGWGAEGSRYTGKEKMIHNGADDNASGSSAVMELARYFSSRQDQLKHSILFCSFSGEEAGLLGSNYFTKNMTVNPQTVRMMLNFDMIGRLKDQENGLAVFGVGTTPEFEEYFKKLDTTILKFVMKEPGTGPSDHTSFYNQNIPVLHFFTGAHKDYHMPSDDVEFIDIPGAKKVIDFAAQTIEHFDQLDKQLVFQKTVDPDAGKMRASFSVTLGVMPDYIAEVKGLRIDGVSADRPADKAGIKAGDVIIKMGGRDVKDIYDYMSCLSKFRKHDTTDVIVERGKDTLDLKVIFE